MERRNTIQKHLILDAVMQGGHPSAEEVYCRVAEKHPSVSRGTVYRNLRRMADDGDILCIEMPNAPDRFDASTENHYHFSCKKCGKMFDMQTPYVSNICTTADEDFLVEGYDLIFKGLCGECLSAPNC